MAHDFLYYLAQGIGFIAFVVAVLSFQQNSQKHILAFQLISSTLFAIHFGLLGASVGALLNVIAAFRALVFVNKDKAWAKSKIWLAVFVVLCIGAGIYTWDGWLSILPILGMIFTTAAFWIEDPKLVRRISLPSSPCWLIYNFFHQSWAGVLTETFVMCSILVAMLRYDRKK